MDEANPKQIVHPLDIFISPAEDMYASSRNLSFFIDPEVMLMMPSYLVTDLMQTDLRTVMDSRSIGDEFVPFLVYQILVWLHAFAPR